MRPELLTLASDLSRRGEPFVIATVVRRVAPNSARSGDTAIITKGGTFHGWLGGSCTRPTVIAEAQKALSDGVPRLIAITPDPNTELRPGIIAMPMTCHSGGSVDVYIEPVLPALRLIVYGVSPAAQALVRIGKVLGYEVEAVDPDADVATFPDADFVITDPTSDDLARRASRDPNRLISVVATLGVWDEEALARALALSPSYVGLIASKKRFGEIQPILRSKGVTPEAIERIRCPAGLDFGAVAPAEIALSVMCEVIQTLRASPSIDTESVPVEAPRDSMATEAIDPVCGMTVNPTTSKHRADYAGETYVFCCGGCREKFVAAPEQYALKAGARDGIRR